MNINKIIIGLDMTPTDETVLRYTAWFVKLIKPAKLYFIHIVPDLETFPTPDKVSADEWIESQMQHKVKEHFVNYTDFETEFIGDDGKVYDRIMHWVKVKKADLLLIGKKPDQRPHPGVLPATMVTEIPCSLLFVPYRQTYHLDNVIVSSDFSTKSIGTMQTAVDLANTTSHVSLYCQYIYDLPSGYTTSGKSEVEYEQIMYENAKQKYVEFIDNIDQKGQRITPILTYAEEENAPDLVYERADEIHADLIIAAGRGRTFLANLLLKSFTKELFEKNGHVPLLILRTDKPMDWSEAISKL